MRSTITFLVMFCFCSFYKIESSHAQIITTISGSYTGSIGSYSGDGGPASAARLWHPGGMNFDTSGNLYFSDINNERVRKIDTHGIITKVAGNGSYGCTGDSGPATNANFAAINDVDVDYRGNIYIEETDSPSIRKVNVAGIINTIAGNKYAGYAGDGGLATASIINGSGNLRADKYGNLYFPDALNNRIRKIDTAGIITTIAGNGTAGHSGDGGPATAAALYRPTGITLDNTGNIYIVDSQCYIRKIDTVGIITNIASNGTVGYRGDGGMATDAELSMFAISIDSKRNIYIADDVSRSRIRKINTVSGRIYTIAGIGSVGYAGDGGPAILAQFSNPQYTAEDSQANIYISDEANNVIRKITLPAIRITASTGTTICAGTPVVFTASVTNDAATPQYQWQLNSSAVSTDTAAYATDTLHNGDTVRCVLSYQMGDTVTTTSNIMIITVDTFVVSAGMITGTDTVCAGTTATLTDTIPGGVWTTDNSHATVSAGEVVGVSPGTDTIIYTITNACGTVATAHAVQVIVCPNSVATTAAEGENLLIYPNPTAGNFSITLPAATKVPAQVTITDIVGKTVAEINTTTNNKNEVTLHAADGVYFITATAGGKKYYSKLVVSKS